MCHPEIVSSICSVSEPDTRFNDTPNRTQAASSIAPLRGLARSIRQVWAWNFEKEFSAFLALAINLGADAIIAFDAEFPECECLNCTIDPLEKHTKLCECLDSFWPIQLGFALADTEGTFHGSWSFNLMFEMESDLDTQAGVNPFIIGQRLATSSLVGKHAMCPLWLTFGGKLDVGYLLKILIGQRIPQESEAFLDELVSRIPRLSDLQDFLHAKDSERLLHSIGLDKCEAQALASNKALGILKLHLHVTDAVDWKDTSISGLYEPRCDDLYFETVHFSAPIDPRVQPPQVSAPPGLAHGIREVWAWNFEKEFSAFLALALSLGADAIIAFDAEFPDWNCQDFSFLDPSEKHVTLCEYLDLLWPIQLGFALADTEGTFHGAWSFNLMFEMESDLDTRAGVNPFIIGHRLAMSNLISNRAVHPLWLTFGGALSVRYLMKILGAQQIPHELELFDDELSRTLTRFLDLHELMPQKELEHLLVDYGIGRCGSAPTASNNALAILELHLVATDALYDWEDLISLPSAPLSLVSNKVYPDPLAEITLEQEMSAAITHSSLKSVPLPRLACSVKEVWAWNFEKEMSAFLALAVKFGTDAIISFNAEFPNSKGWLTRLPDRFEKHAALCQYLDSFWPIQLGFALADPEGTLHGAWSFNLMFETEADLDTKAGINPFVIGQRLTDSRLIGSSGVAPLWLTCGGILDVGYIMKIATGNRLQGEVDAFDHEVAHALPRLLDVQHLLPRSIERCAPWPSASSNALAALELQLGLVLGSHKLNESVIKTDEDDHAIDACWVDIDTIERQESAFCKGGYRTPVMVC